MKTQIIAHRGASAYYPENTMAAFEAAIMMGAEAIELDVHMSKDGEIIVIHDETLERTTSGTGYVHQLTRRELQALEADILHRGYRQQERLSALDDVLRMAQKAHVWVNIEIRQGGYPGIADGLVKTIHSCGMQNNVLVSSFDHFALLELRKLWPDAPIALLHVCALVEPWEYAQKLNAKAMHPLHPVALIPGWVESCHKHGIVVHAWTADDESTIEKLLRAGVDGIVTNKPDVALNVREKLLQKV